MLVESISVSGFGDIGTAKRIKFKIQENLKFNEVENFPTFVLGKRIFSLEEREHV